MEEFERKLTINTYETVIIFDTDSYKGNVEIFRDMCQEFTGKKYKIKEERLGVKKLAYEIKEHTEAYYVVFTWKGTIENTAELERHMRINDSVLKFITVKHEDDDLEFQLEEASESEQDVSEEKPDAMDVLLGFAEYTKKEVN